MSPMRTFCRKRQSHISVCAPREFPGRQEPPRILSPQSGAALPARYLTAHTLPSTPQNQTYTPESPSPSDSRWQAKGSIPLSRLRSVGHTQSVRLFPSACFPPEQTLEGFLDLRAPFPDQLTHKAVRAGIGPVGAYFLFPRKLMIDQGL